MPWPFVARHSLRQHGTFPFMCSAFLMSLYERHEKCRTQDRSTVHHSTVLLITYHPPLGPSPHHPITLSFRHAPGGQEITHGSLDQGSSLRAPTVDPAGHRQSHQTMQRGPENMDRCFEIIAIRLYAIP